MGYCPFNLHRKDFGSCISIPSGTFRRLLKHCPVSSRNKTIFYGYIPLASWKFLEHLKCSCFQKLRADKLKCHTTYQTYSYFEALCQRELFMSFFLVVHFFPLIFRVMYVFLIEKYKTNKKLCSCF